MSEQKQQPSELDRIWEKEWGPQISPWRRYLGAIAIIGAFFGLLIGIIITAGR